jgi:hypothetical protein
VRCAHQKYAGSTGREIPRPFLFNHSLTTLWSAINRLLKKSSTALITQIRKNDYTDISRSFNLCNLIFYLCNQRLLGFSTSHKELVSGNYKVESGK